MKPQIYGKLEKIANENFPGRDSMCFFLKTLAKKGGHTKDELLSCIYTQTSWKRYESKKNKNVNDFVNLVNWAVGGRQNLFSSLNKKENRTEPPHRSSPKVWRLFKGFARTTAHNEVSLDLDDKESFKNALELFVKWELKGNCRTWEGGKGGHISLFFDESIDKAFRQEVRKFFNADPDQINCSVEGKPHQKTGNVVKVLVQRTGLNSVEDLKKLIRR